MKVLVVVVLCLFASPAFAQKKTEMTFKPENVEGGVVKPLTEDVTTRSKGKSSSLITVRKDFVDQMVASVSDI